MAGEPPLESPPLEKLLPTPMLPETSIEVNTAWRVYDCVTLQLVVRALWGLAKVVLMLKTQTFF